MGGGALSDLWENFDHVWLRRALTAPDIDMLGRVAELDGGAGLRIAPNENVTAALAPVVHAITSKFEKFHPVRLVSFDKSPDQNWQVPWHQDRVIAVKDKVDVYGYSNWSQKAGVWHCEPPKTVLDQMLFVRVFLDPCSADTGGMEFAAGSHRTGLVPSSDADDHAAHFPSEIEVAEAGDVLVLPMLTLHRSQVGQEEAGRRVLRIDFAKNELSAPLQWLDYQQSG